LLVEKIKPIIEEMIKKQNTPTFFEIVTAMAFQHFYDKSVDFAIVEVGLGGRFDATNIVNPELSIITNVSLEHEKILGKRIEDIAYEKGGIIKEGVPIITAATGKALEKIKSIAKERNASLLVIDENSYKRKNFDNTRQEFLIKGLLNEYYVKTSMLGLHQGENIAISIAAIENLQINGLFVTDQAIIEGIEKTYFSGRMEIIGSDPRIILDGAHNIEAIKILKRTIENDFRFEKLIVVIGILSDKNIKKMLEIILPISDIIIATKSTNYRACNPNKMLDIAMKISPKKQCFGIEYIKEAIIKAQNISKNGDLILITGSLFTVGEARDFFTNNKYH
jgi:dihydrofolate synthase/folylpolyglutamate synthase